MNAVRFQEVIKKDGEILLTGLSYKKGQQVECIVLGDEADSIQESQLTADKLLHSEIVGMWRDREDLADSATYARQLRERAQHRRS